ncbi:MAG TPA: hypothetical protein VF316_14525 [Polyangiaceae bacterium]
MRRWVVLAVSVSAAALAVACGGRVSGAELTDASLDDASDDAPVDGAATDAADAGDAPATVELDAASCASRAISAACSDGGTESFLQTTIWKCGPRECGHAVHVTLDTEGCPTSVRVRDHNDGWDFPDLTQCVASALSTQRWSCGDAGAVTDYVWFFSCSN